MQALNEEECETHIVKKKTKNKTKKKIWEETKNKSKIKSEKECSQQQPPLLELLLFAPPPCCDCPGLCLDKFIVSGINAANKKQRCYWNKKIKK